jgi:adenylate cyclase
VTTGGTTTHSVAALAELTRQLQQSADVDALLTDALELLGTALGFEHSALLLADETGAGLYTVATRGYQQGSIGSEVPLGEGVIGRAAASGRPARVNNLQRMLAYAQSVRRATGETDIPLPTLPSANSQLAVPAIALGRSVGVLAVQSERMGAFSQDDEDLLSVVAHLVATAILLDRIDTGPPVVGELQTAGRHAPASTTPARITTVRFFASDGSTFLDDEYLIKGVAGRILWRLVTDHVRDGRTDFTNREVRLDPSLELPAYKDNLENRLILLKRRLDDRGASMRINRTGRGRFRLEVDGTLRAVLDGAA